MIKVVGVRFKPAGKIYYFAPGELSICEEDGVIVETARGIEFGDVAEPIHEVPDEMVVQPLKEVVRVATVQDREQRERNRAKEQEASKICEEKILDHELEMKLVDVEYAFNGSKIVFYFTADGRVDFRELVKDLASIFKTRIELRQIGVRDEAKMLGGLGSCGRPICCKSFLADFQPVSIKMAKEQNLSLSPTKISGLCGRLMCCLKYEQDAYEFMRKQMPKVNKDVMTPDGRGQVLENNVITERTRVRVSLNDGTFDVREYEFRLLTLARELTPEEKDEAAALQQARQEQQAARAARIQRVAKPRPKPRRAPGEPLEANDAVAETAAPEKEEKIPAKRRRPRRRNRKKSEGGIGNPNAGQAQTE